MTKNQRTWLAVNSDFEVISKPEKWFVDIGILYSDGVYQETGSTGLTWIVRADIFGSLVVGRKMREQDISYIKKQFDKAFDKEFGR